MTRQHHVRRFIPARILVGIKWVLNTFREPPPKTFHGSGSTALGVFWPYLFRDADHVEKLKRHSSRMVKRFHSHTYEERLRKPDLFSMPHRRLHVDIILTYQVRYQNLGFFNFTQSDFFNFFNNFLSKACRSAHFFNFLYPSCFISESTPFQCSNSNLIRWIVQLFFSLLWQFSWFR